MSLTATDFFCGMGGSSTGLARVGYDIALAANHWDRAIETHSANHPDTEHLCGDIQAIDMRYLPRTDVLWASPICTELSPAGGRARRPAQAGLFEEHGHVATEAFTRTRVTFWEVIRAAETHRYPIIRVENVVEAAAWELFDVWLSGMATLGYEHQFVSVSSAHVGSPTNPYAPQWRDRLYIVLHLATVRRPDVEPRPWAWCETCGDNVPARQWWKRPGRRIGKYGTQYIYVCPVGNHGQVEPWVSPAVAAIDWTNTGTRIGDRRRPLAAATMRRIQTGLDMLARGDFDTEFCLSVNHDAARHFDPATRPLPTETAKQGNGLVIAAAGNTWDAASQGRDGYTRAWPADNSPIPTQSTTAQHGLVTMLRAHGRPRSLTEPLATISTGRNHGLTTWPPGFIAKSYGGHAQDRHMLKPVTEPLGTVRTTSGDFLVIPYRKGSRPYRAADSPLGTQSTRESAGIARPAIDINDVHFRMLTPRESANAQAFPRDYKILGNKGEQQIQSGNAVSTNVAAWLGGCAATSLDERPAA